MAVDDGWYVADDCFFFCSAFFFFFSEESTSLSFFFLFVNSSLYVFYCLFSSLAFFIKVFYVFNLVLKL
jgi:hypothetical protein